MRRISMAFCLAALIASPAQARWHVAESEHFVIYADDSQRDVSRFADQLERYHSAMEFLSGRKFPELSPSNRVTIYAVGNARTVQGLIGASANVAGFYTPRAGGSSAFVQDVRVTTREVDFTMTVLLHEYAHHFLMSTTRYAMPRWVGEGAAEFYASARFPRNGEVEIGRPANHRAGELFFAREVPLSELFEYGQFGEEKRGSNDDFYGRSWLLFHYLTFNPERAGQLTSYLQAIAGGKGSLEAAQESFGDLDKLDDDLSDYLGQRKMNMFRLTPDMLSAAPVTVRELSEGMNQVLPLMIQSKSGVTREEALELLPQIREVAARFPDDAGVHSALAEAEFDAGNNAEAIAAADRALAIDGSQVNAYVQKGYALFSLAAEADDEEAAYRAAVAPFTALNRIENDHPLPLIFYYRSFAERGKDPPELARHAIERASELAPFDRDLAMNVAIMHANEGKIELARHELEPLAADPHDGQVAQGAQRILALLARSEEGEPVDGMQLSLALVAALPDPGLVTSDTDEPGSDTQ